MFERKRILILTADAGFGHRSAANALAEALQETRGSACTIDVVNPYDDSRVPAFLRDTQADQDRMVREMPELYKLGYEASDAAVPSVVVESALILMLFEVMHDIVKQYRPDAVVTTYPLYQAALDAVRVLTRKKFPILTVITDLATVHRLWFNEAVDACLVPTETVRELALKYGLDASRVHLTGIPVNPRLVQEQRPAAEIRAALGWQADLITVLAVGSRRVRNLGEVLNVLNHSRFVFQLAVVTGGDDELYHHFQNTQWHVPVRLYNFVQNMPEMMHASDCIVSKAGGLIVTEALACGLPMLLIDVNPGQEVGNAEYVLSGAAGARAEQPCDALEIMYHWLDEDGKRLVELSANAHRLGHARAAYDAAEIVWLAAEQNLPGKPRKGLQLSLERNKLLELLKLDGGKLWTLN